MLPTVSAVIFSPEITPLTVYLFQVCADPVYVNSWLSAVIVTGAGVIVTVAVFVNNTIFPPAVAGQVTFTTYVPTSLNLGFSEAGLLH